MDRIQDLLARLADLTDAEIAELEGLILTEFDSAESQDPTTESVEQMVALADALDEVRGETGRRTEAADALSAKRSEVAARVHGTTEEQPAESEMAAGKADDEEDSPAADEELPVVPDLTPPVDADVAPVGAPEDAAPAEDAPAPEAEPVVDAPPEEEEEAAAAAVVPPVEGEEEAPEDEDEEDKDKKKSDSPALSTETDPGEASADEPQENHMTAANDNGTGVVITPPADAAPVPTRPSDGLGVTITAGADIPGFGTGSVLENMDNVADAFAKRLHTLRNAQGSGLQHVIATLSFEYPETRQLRGDNSENLQKITELSTPQPIEVNERGLTAAAGICAPLEDYFDFTICGVDDRPIRDALVRFNADRGGLRIYPLPGLDPSGGVGIWNPGVPNGPASGIPKTCVDAVCPVPESVGLEAIYACIKFSNYTNRFFPEVIKANTDLAMIHHARVSELNLIKKIWAASSGVSGKPVLEMGVTRTLIRTVSDAAAYLRRIHRLDANGPIRIILPNWMLDAMIADLAQQMPGDGLETLSLTAAKIISLFSGRGINITWSLDDWNATADQAPPPSVPGQGFETTVSFPMYPEGSFLFLDGGTLDLGVQRDMTMVGDNEYATFVETFEGVAKIKCESLWVTMDVCVSGSASALVQGVC